jgi:uncharacterized protein (TIGR03083 family)
MADDSDTSTMIPTETIDMLEATWRSVATLGASLSEPEWKSATDLPCWTVQDNLSHLIGTERMLQGLPPSVAPNSVGGHVKNAIGELNEAEVEARRPLTGAEVERSRRAAADDAGRRR